MAANQTSRSLFAFVGAISLTLCACSEPAPPSTTRYDDLPAGRFVVVPVPGTREMIQLDTGSGKTWRLMWSVDEDGTAYPTGWHTLDDNDFPVR